MKSLLYILEHLKHNDLIKELSYLDVVVDEIKNKHIDRVLRDNQEYWTIFDKSASVFTPDVIGDIISSFGAYKIRSINNRQFKIISNNPNIVIAIVALAYQHDYELNEKNSQKDIVAMYNELCSNKRLDIRRLEKDEIEWWK